MPNLFPDAPQVHNLVVCTLCSCYPMALLGELIEYDSGRDERLPVIDLEIPLPSSCVCCFATPCHDALQG